MQKHERTALTAARDEAGKLGFTVELVDTHSDKCRLLMMRDGVVITARSLACSPKNRHDVIGHVRQWVRRAGRAYCDTTTPRPG